jgi:hypothetical protein
VQSSESSERPRKYQESEMNHKSLLSEYCQGNSIPFPEYKSAAVGGESHCPLFKGIVSFNGKTYETVEHFPKKKAADEAAARLVWDTISKNEDKGQSSPKLPSSLADYFIVLDLDNQNQYNKYWNKLDTNMKILGIGGPRCSLPPSTSSHFEIWQVTSTQRDAADIELAFRLGELVSQLSKDIKIRIFSTDYALTTLVDILKRKKFNAEFSVDIVKWLSAPV